MKDKGEGQKQSHGDEGLGRADAWVVSTGQAPGTSSRDSPVDQRQKEVRFIPRRAEPGARLQSGRCAKSTDAARMWQNSGGPAAGRGKALGASQDAGREGEGQRWRRVQNLNDR